MFSMMDDNIDGKLQKAELKGRLGGMIGGYFAALDTDKDGTLSKVEMTAAQSMMGGGRRRAPASAAAGATTTGGK
jgi:Ca2+-binding EF-hand superfamily protein